MSSASTFGSVIRSLCIILGGAALGAFLGLASAQDTASGFLNADCAARCAANGYDAEFCGRVCWVPDLSRSAEVENLDWKCMTGCSARGGTTRACMANCRRG